MSTIYFKEVNCKNCYKCIRCCPVKAISLKDDRAQIIHEACILCGECLEACPQSAKSVNSEIDKVKAFFEKKYKVYLSIAPSFPAAYNIRNEKIIYRLFKKLGFTFVEETAVGADRVTLEYHRLLLKGSMPNIIESSCATVVLLIEKYFPELIPMLAPVVSPMVAHAKMMKDMYGSRIKVVFLGPCLAKKEEYKDSQNDDLIDAVITYEEFDNWIEEEGLSFEDFEEENNETGYHNIISRFYPAPGGIIKALGNTKKYNYKFVKFDGIQKCIEILKEIRDSDIKGYFFELNSCQGGCLSGPCTNKGCSGYLQMRERLLSYIGASNSSENSYTRYDNRISLKKNFTNKSSLNLVPDEKELIDILRKTGKFSKNDELNCGACGYQSCRDKAIAVYNNKADINMCLPYMRTRAESISNVIMSSTPNAIIALNEELCIQEANSAAQSLFDLNRNEVQNRLIEDFLDCNDFKNVLETGKDIINKKCFYEKYNITVEQTVLFIKEDQLILIIMKDITVDEIKRQQRDRVRSETVEIAQRVIEKQMRVAQEIASLLGETTAETKVALTNLKNSIQKKMGDE
ncbi:MAG: [Fe-Fe] hydrogenase large subunit C-terminal domain-containing protein [Bacillota bacterium]|nr:[Fe-Fe] hydrogenase large subunit C-terminal domain-containing protein [Bacillota bacterium]